MFKLVFTLVLLWGLRWVEGAEDKMDKSCRLAMLSNCALTPEKIDTQKFLHMGGSHIFCMFPEVGYNSDKAKCHKGVSHTNEAFRDRILHLHNDFRNRWTDVAWKGQKEAGFHEAANMRLMTYDLELERLAQQHVDNCLTWTELCTYTPRFLYTQNLAWSCSEVDIYYVEQTDYIFNSWVSKFKNYPSTNESYFIKPYSAAKGKTLSMEFARVVWANTHLVGCARSQYRTKDFEMSSRAAPFCHMIVCNYGPEGPTDMQPLYIVGEAGSKCPNGTRRYVYKAYPYLCSQPKPSGIDEITIDSIRDPQQINASEPDRFNEMPGKANGPTSSLSCGVLTIYILLRDASL